MLKTWGASKRATRVWEHAGLPPPLEAYGALVAGYARRKDADMALSALQDFFELGGQPDAQMFDTVLDVCVRTGRFRRAMQVCDSPCCAFSSIGRMVLLKIAAPRPIASSAQESPFADHHLPLPESRSACMRANAPVLASGPQAELQYVQVVRAMEASDKHVDKARIKSVLEDMMRRQGLVESRNKRQTRNEGLERLKFWLGIPNRYYSEEESESESSSESDRRNF